MEAFDSLRRITRRMYDAGVPLLSGSDTAAGVLDVAPGTSLLAELEQLQLSGIPPSEIIVIATSNAARALGVDAKTGSIAVGKAADFLLLEADPGADVANVRRLEAVVRNGIKVASPVL